MFVSFVYSSNSSSLKKPMEDLVIELNVLQMCNRSLTTIVVKKKRLNDHCLLLGVSRPFREGYVTRQLENDLIIRCFCFHSFAI